MRGVPESTFSGIPDEDICLHDSRVRVRRVKFPDQTLPGALVRGLAVAGGGAPVWLDFWYKGLAKNALTGFWAGDRLLRAANGNVFA
jgi:hypothetical protein